MLLLLTLLTVAADLTWAGTPPLPPPQPDCPSPIRRGVAAFHAFVLGYHRAGTSGSYDPQLDQEAQDDAFEVVLGALRRPLHVMMTAEVEGALDVYRGFGVADLNGSVTTVAVSTANPPDATATLAPTTYAASLTGVTESWSGAGACPFTVTGWAPSVGSYYVFAMPLEPQSYGTSFAGYVLGRTGTSTRLPKGTFSRTITIPAPQAGETYAFFVIRSTSAWSNPARDPLVTPTVESGVTLYGL